MKRTDFLPEDLLDQVIPLTLDQLKSTQDFERLIPPGVWDPLEKVLLDFFLYKTDLPKEEDMRDGDENCNTTNIVVPNMWPHEKRKGFMFLWWVLGPLSTKLTSKEADIWYDLYTTEKTCGSAANIQRMDAFLDFSADFKEWMLDQISRIFDHSTDILYNLV